MHPSMGRDIAVAGGKAGLSTSLATALQGAQCNVTTAQDSVLKHHE